MDRKSSYTLLLLITCSLRLTNAQIATGGTYSLDQSVIANGGAESTGGSYAIIGTLGQPVAGILSTAAGFGVRGGFWQGFLAPTAAAVSIRGRVLTADGRAVSRAIVRFTDGYGKSPIGISNPFGYYNIAGVEAGQSYIITVAAKNMIFAPRVVTVEDPLFDLDLVMLP